jgi:hypothetical protein
MLDLQREQFDHDERFHREIAQLDIKSHLAHLALHFCKYTGRLAEIFNRNGFIANENTALRAKTITDSFIISLCLANTLNFNLSEYVAPNVGSTATLREVGLVLAHQLYPNGVLDDTWLLTVHAVHSAKIAAACEKIDHLEEYSYRNELQVAVLRLCQIALIAAAKNDIDLLAAVRERRKEIRDRNVLLSAIHQNK